MPYEVRGKSVRVYFNWEGEKCRENIGAATPENIERAERLAKIIALEIESGTFDYARHFPNSKRVSENTLAHYASAFMDIHQSKVSQKSFEADRSKVNTHILPRWGQLDPQSVDYVDIEQWLAKDLGHLSSKTQKTIISLLSRMFDLYGAKKRVQYNPCKPVKVDLPDDEDPDPFTLDEIMALTTTATTRLAERDLIEFMLWDGCRPSEAIALACEDVVDLEAGIIRYERAKVNGKYKATKTKRSKRQHRLIKNARQALQRAYAHAMQYPPIEVEITDRDNRTVRKKKIRPLFLRSSGQAFPNDGVLRDRFFKTHCEKSGVRYRGPGNCRHTFISQMLSLGFVPLHWIANHVGHTTTAMIQRKYGKWMPEDGVDMVGMIEKQLEL